MSLSLPLHQGDGFIYLFVFVYLFIYCLRLWSWNFQLCRSVFIRKPCKCQPSAGRENKSVEFLQTVFWKESKTRMEYRLLLKRKKMSWEFGWESGGRADNYLPHFIIRLEWLLEFPPDGKKMIHSKLTRLYALNQSALILVFWQDWNRADISRKLDLNIGEKKPKSSLILLQLEYIAELLGWCDPSSFGLAFLQPAMLLTFISYSINKNIKYMNI